MNPTSETLRCAQGDTEMLRYAQHDKEEYYFE